MSLKTKILKEEQQQQKIKNKLPNNISNSWINFLEKKKKKKNLCC